MAKTETVTLPTTMGGVQKELAEVNEKITALSEKLGPQIVAAESKNDTNASEALTETWAELERLRQRRGQLEGIRSEMTANREAIERGRRQAERRDRWENLQKQIEQLNKARNERLQAVSRTAEAFFAELNAARIANRQIQLFSDSHRELRRDFDPHGVGKPVPEIDLNRLEVLGVELLPSLRLIARDVWQANSVFDVIEDYLACRGRK